MPPIFGQTCCDLKRDKEFDERIREIREQGSLRIGSTLGRFPGMAWYKLPQPCPNIKSATACSLNYRADEIVEATVKALVDTTEGVRLQIGSRGAPASV